MITIHPTSPFDDPESVTDSDPVDESAPADEIDVEQWFDSSPDVGSLEKKMPLVRRIAIWTLEVVLLGIFLNLVASYLWERYVKYLLAAGP